MADTCLLILTVSFEYFHTTDRSPSDAAGDQTIWARYAKPLDPASLLPRVEFGSDRSHSKDGRKARDASFRPYAGPSFAEQLLPSYGISITNRPGKGCNGAIRIVGAVHRFRKRDLLLKEHVVTSNSESTPISPD